MLIDLAFEHLHRDGAIETPFVCPQQAAAAEIQSCQQVLLEQEAGNPEDGRHGSAAPQCGMAPAGAVRAPQQPFQVQLLHADLVVDQRVGQIDAAIAGFLCAQQELGFATHDIVLAARADVRVEAQAGIEYGSPHGHVPPDPFRVDRPLALVPVRDDERGAQELVIEIDFPGDIQVIFRVPRQDASAEKLRLRMAAGALIQCVQPLRVRDDVVIGEHQQLAPGVFESRSKAEFLPGLGSDRYWTGTRSR